MVKELFGELLSEALIVLKATEENDNGRFMDEHVIKSNTQAN